MWLAERKLRYKKIISALPPKGATFLLRHVFYLQIFILLIWMHYLLLRMCEKVFDSEIDTWNRSKQSKQLISKWVCEFDSIVPLKTMISKSVHKVESIYALNMCTECIFWVQYWSFQHHEPSNDFDFEMSYIERYYIDRRKLTFFSERQRVIKSCNFLYWIQFRTKYSITSQC